ADDLTSTTGSAPAAARDEDDAEDASEDEEDEESEARAQADLADAMGEVGQGEREELQTTAVPIRNLMGKIRKITTKVNNSPTVLLPLWESKCQLVKLKPRQLRQDVTTRWNSAYDSGRLALEYRAAIDAMVSDRT
ncbi:hypothetical protein BKA62DRAFT_596824, partial [Auriculariales sp. MPI-PUGE-AT-0066]